MGLWNCPKAVSHIRNYSKCYHEMLDFSEWIFMVKWSEEWQLRLTEGKCKVIHLPVGTNNPIYIYI